jgi:hypothetical protein
VTPMADVTPILSAMEQGERERMNGLWKQRP